MGKTFHSNNTADAAMENTLWSISLEEKTVQTNKHILTSLPLLLSAVPSLVFLFWLCDFSISCKTKW